MLAPKACDVRVSCALFSPIIIEWTMIVQKVLARPTTATFIGSVKVPAKIICVIEVLVKPSKFVIVAGIASLRNVLSIRPEAGGSDFGLNIAFLSSFVEGYSFGSFVAYSRG